MNEELAGQISSLNNQGLFQFSMSGLISGIIFGVIGLYVFRYARKQNNFTNVLIGIALMVYPYFTAGPWQDWGIGIILCGAAYYFR